MTLRGQEPTVANALEGSGLPHSPAGSGAESGAVSDDLPVDVIELARRLVALTPETRAALAALLAGPVARG